MLSRSQVWEILGSAEPYKDQGERHGVSSDTIKRIRNGKTYCKIYTEYCRANGLPPKASRWRMTKDCVFSILSDPGRLHEVSKKHGVSEGMVSQIRHGKRYGDWHHEYCELYGRPEGRILEYRPKPWLRKENKRPSRRNNWLTVSWR